MPHFSVPGTKIRLEYKEVVARTGTNIPLLFVASDGKRSRGVVIKLADMLLWEMKPKPQANDYPELATQVSIPHLQKLMSNPDAFFAKEDDEVLLLNRANSPTTWDPSQKVLT
jgi:hypothetical protein